MQSSTIHTATSYTDVSYHSSDDELEVTSTNEGEVYEEVTDVDEDEVSNDSGSYHEEEEEEEAENASAPVKSNAPVPLHQLLAAKLKNTNIKLSEPRTGTTRSVKDMAAAFSPPRPTSFTRRTPIESAPPPWANKQLKKVEPKSETPAPSTSPIQIVRRKQPPPAAAMPVPKKRAVINIKGKPMKKPQPREVDKMEKLSEGGSQDESSSSVPVSVVSERQESSSSSEEISISEVQDNSEHQSRQPPIIPQGDSKKSNMKRRYDGTVDGDSSSSSSYSFSVSSGTDESLAAKLGDLGTPFAPMPIAANFIPEDTNHDESASSSSNSPTGTRSPDEDAAREGTFGLERQVSWSDLLGDGIDNEDKPRASSVGGSPGNGGNFRGNGDDGDDETSYESYETASSDEEFETDTERDISQMAGPPDVYLAQLNDDQESPATSDYETDTSYERIHAEAEGRTPPPPKKPIVPFLSPSGRPSYSPMPMVNENAISDDWSDEEDRRRRQQQNSFYAKHGRRRKPFEDVPTAVAAELRQVSKNDPATSGGGAAPMGITGWDGENGQGSGNCFDRIFKKKGDREVTDLDELPPIPLPQSPLPYDTPDYNNDDDEVSNITDRVFSPKKPTPEQEPLYGESETSESQRSRDASGRFSITKFRKSNSVRNTERALEGLKVTSIEPKIVSKYKKQKRNIPALLNMQNEAVDFYVPREHDSITQTTGDFDDDMGPSSSRAYDSRDVETPRMGNDVNYDYDPMRTEIVEERFVGYDDDDDGDYASHSRYEFNDEEDVVDRPLNRKYGRDKKNTTPVVNVDETLKPRKSKRLGCITCIVICNLLLLLGLGTWLLLEYFYLQEGSSWPWQGRPAIPSSKSGDIKAELVKILKPNLPDGETVFNDETSPQSEALDWMTNDPYIHTYDEEKISIRFALATFYYSTEGDSWTTNHLWLSDLDECLWYTSSMDSPCTAEGRFARLVLNDNNLQGELPRELTVLSNDLVSLDVDGTFTGEIPSNVGDLAKLTTLRLSGRVLSGQIPSSLYTLSDLSTLDLGQNLLSGELSWAIVKMSSSLRSMSLMGNHLIGSFPKEIGQLTGLTHFNIDDNYFDNISHEEIGRLTNLETLSMRNNVLKGSLPSTIGNSLTNLKGLFLNNNEFTGSIPDSYGNLSNLESGLDLSSNKLTGTVPESLGHLSMLKNLLLRDNGLSGTIPSSWGKLSVLRTLRLDSTNFEGELPTQVCDSFNEAYSSYYVDCWKLDCPCCNFCCDGGECICRFADSLPILCVEP